MSMTQRSKSRPSIGRRVLEFLRKRVVALKRKPQTIAFLVLIAGFIYYTLNLTVISHTTSLVQNGTGLSAFVTLLASTLALVAFLRTYPRRQKTKIGMLILCLVLLAAALAGDYAYHQLVVNAVTKSGNSYIYDEANLDGDARTMVISQARKIDEDNAQSVLDAITGTDENGKACILEDKLAELVRDGTIDPSAQLPEGVEDTPENRLGVFYETDRKTGEPKLKSVRGVQIAVRNTFTDMRDSIRKDGESELDATTLDLVKLRAVIDSGKLGIRHQVFDEDGAVNPAGFNAAYRDVNGTPMFYDLNCHFVRDDYVRISVRDKAVNHGYADRMLLITVDEETGSLLTTLDGKTDGTYVRIVMDEGRSTVTGVELARKVSDDTYRVDKLLDAVLDKDTLDILLNRLQAGENEIMGLYDSATGVIVLEKADSLYMDLVEGREDYEGSGTLALTMDYKLRYEAGGTTYRIKNDYGFFTQAHHVLVVHVILLLAGIFLLITKPLYGALIRKINTSIQVEENSDMDTIDISGEE